MTSPIADPWHWTAKDLVTHIRHPRTFVHVTKPSDLPNIEQLQFQLRVQEITGAKFLANVSVDLFPKLRVLRHGQQVALLEVVQNLRERSVAYKQQAAAAGVQALGIGNRSTATSSTRPHDTPVSSAIPGPNGRKRQKRADVTTMQLDNIQQQPQPQPAQGNLKAPYQLQPFVDGTGEWDYLARWEQSDEDSVGVDDLSAGDVDIEEEDGDDVVEAAEDDAAEVSDGADNNEHAQSRSKLSRDQIVDIINERIEHYTNIWKPNQGVLKGDEKVYDPDAMWEAAEKANDRPRYIKTYETDIAYYRQRLDRLCDEIVRFPGRSADAVRNQCRNLEVTVNEIELSEWLLSIYQLEPYSEDEEDEEGEEEELPGIGGFPLHHSDQRSVARPTPPSLVQAQQRSTAHYAQPLHAPADQRLMAHLTQPLTEVIDLGSPPESSQEMDGVLVDSFPPPELLVGVEESVRSTDSLIADTIEQMVEMPVQVAVRPQAQYSDQPENASISSARRWRWQDLVAAQDRKRITTKALVEMRDEDRETLRGRLRAVGTTDMIQEIPACIKMLIEKKPKIPGVLHRDMRKILTFTRLYLSWWLCDNYFRIEPSQWDLEELARCYQEGSPDPVTFCEYLGKIMTTTFSPLALQNPDQPSQAEIIEISDDDDEPPPRSTATKRKSKVQHPDTILLD